MRPGLNPASEEIRHALIDAEYRQPFPNAKALFRHVADRHKLNVYDVAAVAILWQVLRDLVTPSPTEWRMGDLSERKKLVARLRRRRAFD
jgi:hypothetical protein